MDMVKIKEVAEEFKQDLLEEEQKGNPHNIDIEKARRLINEIEENCEKSNELHDKWMSLEKEKTLIFRKLLRAAKRENKKVGFYYDPKKDEFGLLIHDR